MKTLTAREMFTKASFIQWMGIELQELENGVCRASMKIRSDMLQHDGFVHAGILTTLADHCCGGSVGSLLKPGEHVLTAEFKSSFLRAATSPEVFCIAVCLKRGKSAAFTEAKVYSGKEMKDDQLLATLSSTLVIRVIA